MQSEDPGCHGDDPDVRAAQRADITSYLQRQAIPTSEPPYVGGDLNGVGSSPEYGEMLSSLHAQAPKLTGHPYSWDCSSNSVCRDQYGPEYPPEQLDYVLAVDGHPAPEVLVNETRAVKSPKWSVGPGGRPTPTPTTPTTTRSTPTRVRSRTVCASPQLRALPLAVCCI